jgi:multidrug efflux pump subunit AcrB
MSCSSAANHVDRSSCVKSTLYIHRDGDRHHVADAGRARAHTDGHLSEIDIPVISMVFNFAGLSPTDIEQRVSSITERYLTTTVNDIEHIESQSYTGVAVIKVFFHPTADIQTALAQVTSAGQSVGRQMPAGSPPPLVVIYSASTVPVVQIALMSPTLSEQQLFDQGNTFIRQQLATVQGASIPQPFGGRQRQISVDLNPLALQQNNLSAVDISNAVAAQNLVLPSGTAKFGSTEYPLS